MPRRKQYKITAREMEVFDAIVAELQQKPELADYDMNTLEISVKKKINPRIQNIDKAIEKPGKVYGCEQRIHSNSKR